MFLPTSTTMFVCLFTPCMYVVCSPYKVDKEVQLVCKYLHAFELKDDKVKGINRRHYSMCHVCSVYMNAFLYYLVVSAWV